MRKITLPVCFLYPAGAQGVTAESGPYSVESGTELRKRAGRITSATSAIEHQMIDVIAFTLLGDLRKHREIVISSLLQSDWCTFASKRKLLAIAIRECNLLQGSAIGELEKLLSSVGKYRNAFAHGTLVHYGTHHCLKYFENEPREVKLDEDYFTELERVFQTAWRILGDMLKKLTAPEPPDAISRIADRIAKVERPAPGTVVDLGEPKPGASTDP